MTLNQIQSNLLVILQGLALFADAQQHILVDDGYQSHAMEASLKSEGLSVLIMQPQCVSILSQGKGVASLEYSATIWVRCNPKIKSDNVAKWDPLACEENIIPQVLAFGQRPVNFFQIPSGLEPETDFTDIGNNSRLIRFSTTIFFK